MIKMSEIFNLAVRLLGLVFLYHGLLPVPQFIQAIAAGTVGNFGNWMFAIFMMGWPLAVSWWLIGGARLIAQRAYPEAHHDAGMTKVALAEKTNA